jgi:hypothetical protein
MLENLEAAQFYTALGKVLTKEDLLFQKKWRCLLKHRRFFFLIPFLDFVLVAGSMALGNINEESDFDMIVGCQKSRIFTVRFFTIVIFGLFGLRRKSTDDGEKQKDKFCFNHFVTSSSYRLRPPYNIYWQELYRHLVPIYGDKSAVIKYLQANE